MMAQGIALWDSIQSVFRDKAEGFLSRVMYGYPKPGVALSLTPGYIIRPFQGMILQKS